jgi:hypothetical protein
MAQNKGNRLDALLNELTQVQLATICVLADNADLPPLFARVMRAVKLEILDRATRGRRVLAELDADHRADVERLAADAVWPGGTPDRSSETFTIDAAGIATLSTAAGEVPIESPGNAERDDAQRRADAEMGERIMREFRRLEGEDGTGTE